MTLQLPALPYAYDALEPFIDAQTMEIHHTKHHATYTNTLVDAIENTDYQDMPIENILADIDSVAPSLRDVIRNHGGGYHNHCLFWQMMTPGGKAPSAALLAEIKTHFGTLESCMLEMSTVATKRFGSGWGWLVRDGTKMQIISTPNQDSPLSQGYAPLLGIDVWEHAYYLRYQNRRAEYITNRRKVVNRARVEEQFTKYQTKKNLLA